MWVWVKRCAGASSLFAAALLDLASVKAAEGQKVSFGNDALHLRGEIVESEENKVVALRLQTDRGDIISRFHPVEPGKAKGLGVVWVGGAGGGLDGPARGLYPAASGRLQELGIASLRLHYRRPNDLDDCVLDTLAGVAFLVKKGATRVALVGHSFGGAVVISAGAVSPHVQAVVPMSSQTAGAGLVVRVTPRPILLIHGMSDDVLSSLCSRQLYMAAGEPKEIKLYPGTGHGLDEVRQEVLDLLVRWIPRALAGKTG